MPYVRVNELVNGKRRVTPSTALRLARAFGTSPEFWLNGQLALDLYRTINDKKEVEEVDRRPVDDQDQPDGHHDRERLIEQDHPVEDYSEALYARRERRGRLVAAALA